MSPSDRDPSYSRSRMAPERSIRGAFRLGRLQWDERRDRRALPEALLEDFLPGLFRARFGGAGDLGFPVVGRFSGDSERGGLVRFGAEDGLRGRRIDTTVLGRDLGIKTIGHPS